jgi:SAM-dependent methyltransferase
MTDAMKVFDRDLVRRHRDRAASRFSAHDFLFREVGERLAERLEDVTRCFPRALDLGCHGGGLAKILRGRGGIEYLVQCDLSAEMAACARVNGHPTLVVDEELLPYAAASFDLVLSVLSLHWVNDLPGTLMQIRRVLRPDGLLLVAILGGESLRELRQALMEAELAEEMGVSPRVSPFADLRDAGGLLQRAGFALPVADRDRISVTYPDALALMRDLRGMGETNAGIERRRTPGRRHTLFRAAAIYAERFGNAEGRIPASFEVLTLTAWAPADSQPTALRPGSAKARLADVLGSDEISAGEKTHPK